MTLLFDDQTIPKWEWWIPHHYSSFGASIDLLFYWIFAITMVTFIGVEGVLLWFCLKYKRDPNRKTKYVHGSHVLEVWWTLIPTLILVAIGIASNKAWGWAKNPTSSLYPKADDFQTTIRVTGQQFQWNVTYPGADGVFDTDDDYTKNGQMVIPWEEVVNEKTEEVRHQENVNVKLTSKDVIHSLFIPVLRVKQDAVPGWVGNVWFDCHHRTYEGTDGKYWFENPPGTPDDDEVIEIACAELCGMGHYKMRAELKVIPRDKYDAWVRLESAKALKEKSDK
jgi:cytochrome c oxidase subunit 2